ncbi:MAG: hypothetical protein JXQ29_07130 [Planctomycetes bacterium]|nr:hypothetical protein [Planctomycetota bacterium]
MRTLIAYLFACAALMAFAYDAHAAVTLSMNPNVGTVNQSEACGFTMTALTPGKTYKVNITAEGQTPEPERERTADENGAISDQWLCRILDVDNPRRQAGHGKGRCHGWK